MIVIVDYGMGNLRSAQKGIEKSGFDAVISSDPAMVHDAAGVVLPGVGAFKDCAEGLDSRGLSEPVIEAAHSGRPFLGICVGLQLLFEGSEENPGAQGLGIFKGQVIRFPDARKTGLKVPHMGWNRISAVPGRDQRLLPNADQNPHMYFVHSYYAQPDDESVVLATSNHGVDFPAMVGKGNIFATQFHPEKSQKEGIAILTAFGTLVKESVT